MGSRGFGVYGFRDLWGLGVFGVLGFGLKGFMGLTCSSSYGFRGSGVLSLVPRFWCSRSGL